MALQPLNPYGTLSRTFDLFLLGAWIGLLALSRVFAVETLFFFVGISVVLSAVALRWPFLEGALVLLLLSWVWGAFSLMPTAIVFWSLFVAFVVLKLILDSLELRQRSTVALLFFGTALCFYGTQWFLIHRLSEEDFFIGRLFLKLGQASLIEGVSGFLIGPRFLTWISPR